MPRYKNRKVAESTLLVLMKRYGIDRMDRAEHVKKVTVEMERAWVARYEAGESLKEIAGDEFSAQTVLDHLQRLIVKRRDKVTAQRAAVTVHEKKPFSGEQKERAYLLGFRTGDLAALRHGRAVSVETASTHRAM